MAVDARSARESLETICVLCWGASLWTQSRCGDGWPAGAAAPWRGPAHWSRAAFANLDRLPQSEQARWCVWKSVELLYLLSAPEGTAQNVLPAPALDREIARVLAETRRYMEEHLDEPLTIPALSRRAMPLRHHIQGGLSAACTACRSTPGCGSGGWNGRRSCCGTPPSVFWGWLSRSDMAVPASSPPPSAGSTV